MEGRPWKKGSESQCGDPMTQTPELRTPGCMCWGTVPISATFHLYSLYISLLSLAPASLLNTGVQWIHWPEALLASKEGGMQSSLVVLPNYFSPLTRLPTSMPLRTINFSSVNMTRVQVTQGIFSLDLLFSPFPFIGGSKQKMVRQPLVQFSSTLGLTSCHLATPWPLVLYFPSKCQLLCHVPNSQKSVCAHPCCFLVSVSVSYDVSLWWSLKFHEARRRRKKEGCCDLRADPKTVYFFYV